MLQLENMIVHRLLACPRHGFDFEGGEDLFLKMVFEIL